MTPAVEGAPHSGTKTHHHHPSSSWYGPGGCSAAASAHVTGSSSSDQLQLCSKTSTSSSVAGCRSCPPLHPAPSSLPSHAVSATLADRSLKAPRAPQQGAPLLGCWGPAVPHRGHVHGCPPPARRGISVFGALPVCGRDGMQRGPPEAPCRA